MNLIDQNVRKWFLPQTNSRHCCKGSCTMRVAPAIINLAKKGF